MIENYQIDKDLILRRGLPSMASWLDSLGDKICLDEVIANPEHYRPAIAPTKTISNFLTEDGRNTVSHYVLDVKSPWVRTLPLLYYTGNPADGVIKGTYPTFTDKLATFSPNGNKGYELRRTDEYLTVYNRSTNKIVIQFHASQFRDKIVPYSFLIELQGGGSGGSGSTHSHETVGNLALDGAGGGGGGYALGVFTFVTPDSWFLINAGAGGAGGANTIAVNADSKAGENSFIIFYDNSQAYCSIDALGGIAARCAKAALGPEGGIGQSAGFNKHADTKHLMYPDAIYDQYGINGLHIIETISGASGAGADNGFSSPVPKIYSKTLSCVGDNSYKRDVNVITAPGGQQGRSNHWGGGIFGSGGGGASASGNGGDYQAAANKQSAGPGAGGGGAYWSSHNTGEKGGDGYIKIYY